MHVSSQGLTALSVTPDTARARVPGRYNRICRCGSRRFHPLQRIHHQVWVLSGAIEVTVGSQTHALAAGDCLDFVLDRTTRYCNRERKPARYAVVVVEE
jgi:hypothetical protein